MHAPPLVAFAGGACPATAASSPSPWLASPRAAILAAPARLLRSRRGALRLEAKAAWRAAGGGRGPRVPAKGAVLASYMGAEEVVGPSSLLDEEGLVCCCFCFQMQSACAYIAHISFSLFRTSNCICVTIHCHYWCLYSGL